MSGVPELLDAKALQSELGVTRSVAEKVMRQLPVVEFPGIRKVYVRRSDLARYVDSCTSPGEWQLVYRKNGPAVRGEAPATSSTGPTRVVVSQAPATSLGGE
jgi:hypothetical protein